MSRLVEHINRAASDVGDLTVDQPATHRWLPTDAQPVLATPTITYAVGLALMAVTGAGGCSSAEICTG